MLSHEYLTAKAGWLRASNGLRNVAVRRPTTHYISPGRCVSHNELRMYVFFRSMSSL